jgi:hypothetical protein
MVKKKTQKRTRKSFFSRKAPTEDFKTALILVSVTINLAFFIGWLALRLTNAYDAQVYNILFTR